MQALVCIIICMILRYVTYYVHVYLIIPDEGDGLTPLFSMITIMISVERIGNQGPSSNGKTPVHIYVLIHINN